MSKETLSYAMRTVPRYTSYPTAPHFHAGVNGTAYAGWLEELNEQDSLSLYLHVPFCRDICHYCGCHTKASKQDAPLERYAETLAREIDLLASHLKAPGPLRHIHWGGGTPSLLPQHSLVMLVDKLKQHFTFAHDIEHAIELDPRYVSQSLADTLAQIGVTRASLGVQDLDPDVQNAIGRPQSYKVVCNATGYLRQAGVTDINFDLMYGLPHQTVETIQDTVARTIDLKPGRIALFGYAHVPWMKKNQRLIDENSLPSSKLRIRLADIAREHLQAAGYRTIGLDHFALPDDSMALSQENGSLRRNFQGYTTDQGEQLIGLGVSSIGKLRQGYVQNITDVGNWERAVNQGILPVAKGIEMSADDHLRARIIEQLMTDHICDVEETCKFFDIPPETLLSSMDELDELVCDNLVQMDGWRVIITERGRPYVRLAAAAFDAYLEGKHAGTRKHSLAV